MVAGLIAMWFAVAILLTLLELAVLGAVVGTIALNLLLLALLARP